MIDREGLLDLFVEVGECVHSPWELKAGVEERWDILG